MFFNSIRCLLLRHGANYFSCVSILVTFKLRQIALSEFQASSCWIDHDCTASSVPTMVGLAEIMFLVTVSFKGSPNHMNRLFSSLVLFSAMILSHGSQILSTTEHLDGF
jgi:saccharopine dehydrogenase-like NADP-dependent oxidoreductase